jgi:hypothetical protein
MKRSPGDSKPSLSNANMQGSLSIYDNNAYFFPRFSFLVDACAKSQNQQMATEPHTLYSELSVNNFNMQCGGLYFA